MSQVCAHYLVSGRVQGVGYRYFVERVARAFHIRGWVRNLRDGRVELVACADEETLQALEARLWQGPPSADVSGVARTSVPDGGDVDFAIR